MLFVAFQKYALRLPLNKICMELRDYFGIKVSQAALFNSLRLLSAYFGRYMNEIKKR
jgi:hypothetical protein